MLEEALACGQEEATRAEARLLMADIYREQRRYREAEALLLALLAGPLPLRMRVEALRALAYLCIGDHPRAAEYALEAYRLAQAQDPYWRVLMAAFLVGADVERGEPLAHCERAEAARALGPFDVSEYLELVLARACLEAGEAGEALKLLAGHPGEALGPAYTCLAWAYRSQAHLALGQEEAARGAFAEVLALAKGLGGPPGPWPRWR